MIFGESPIKDAYRRMLWGPGRHLLNAVPCPYELHAVRGMGRLAARGLAGRRARLRDNLGRAFPERASAELDSLARAAFSAHFSNQYLGFTFPKCDAKTWPNYLRFEGLHHLEAAHALGRGVVLMHPHMGPAQLPLHVLGVLGWPMHQVGGGEVTAVELSPTGKWAADTRAALERHMPVTLHDGKGYLRPVLRALKAGDVVMSAADATGGGKELGRRYLRQVLGQPWPVPVGPVWMAWRSGAPLLTIHCHRDPSVRPGAGPGFVAEIGPELVLERDLPMRQALESGADLLAAWLDSVLRAWPGDWLFWDAFEPGGLLAEHAP